MIAPSSRFRLFLGTLACALSYPYLMSVMIMADMSFPFTLNQDMWLGISILFELTALGVLWWVLRSQMRSWRSLGLHMSGKFVLHSIGLFIVAYAIYYLTYVSMWYGAYFLTGMPLTISTQTLTFLQEGTSWIWWVYIFINPWFEELLIHAYAMTELTVYRFATWSITLCSVGIQTGYHLYQGSLFAVLESGLFLVFALYYHRTRQALPIVLAHGYFDIMGFLAYR